MNYRITIEKLTRDSPTELSAEVVFTAESEGAREQKPGEGRPGHARVTIYLPGYYLPGEERTILTSGEQAPQFYPPIAKDMAEQEAIRAAYRMLGGILADRPNPADVTI
jgi:hypothetical protein